MFSDYYTDIAPEIESTVPAEYEGRCKLHLETDKGNKSEAVFPSFKEARHAASIAVNPNYGGYPSARIEVTTDEITHETGIDWFAN